MGNAILNQPVVPYHGLATSLSGQLVIESIATRCNTSGKSPWPCIFEGTSLTGRGQELPTTKNDSSISITNVLNTTQYKWFETYTDQTGINRGIIDYGKDIKSFYIPANITCNYNFGNIVDGPATIPNVILINAHFYWTPPATTDISPIRDERSWTFFQCMGVAQNYRGLSLNFWTPQTSSCDNWMKQECQGLLDGSGQIYPTLPTCNCLNSTLSTRLIPKPRYNACTQIINTNIVIDSSAHGFNVDERIILNGQTRIIENGIYVASLNNLIRSTDLRVDADIRSTGVVKVGDDWYELKSTGPFDSETEFTATIKFMPHLRIQPVVTCLDNDCSKDGYRTHDMSNENCNLTFCQSIIKQSTNDLFLSSNQTLFCGDQHYDITIPGSQSFLQQQTQSYNYEKRDTLSQGIWIGIYAGIIVITAAFILWRVFRKPKTNNIQ